MDNPLNFFQKTILKNYLSDSLEISYSQYGPTMAISGTLTALKTLVFVNNISLILTREKDGERYQYVWLAFRPHRFAKGGYIGIDLEMPSKFMVTPEMPYKYNILFSDQNRYLEINPILKIIKKEWGQFFEENALRPNPLDSPTLFKNFLQKDHIGIAVRNLEELCYWQEGKYSLRIIIVAKNSKQVVEDERSFVLSPAEVQQLRKNTITIFADLCRQSNLNYFFTYPRLQ